MKTRTIGIAALAAGVMLCAGACQRKQAAQSAPAAPPGAPVEVATAEKGDMPVVIDAIGSVMPTAQVTLRPQVAGRVAELTVSEGTNVKEGEPLLRLDSRPFDAALAEAEANLTRGKALAADAHDNATRVHEASKSAATSIREQEQADAQAAAADAEVLADQAKVESARLNVAYCTIAAPFAGRLGQFLVKPGSIVKENETDLVEIVRVDPIEVSFTILEENLQFVRAAADAGPLRVVATPSGEAGRPEVGTLSYIDNRVDTQTGSVLVKATFANGAHRLWPGRFANVEMVVDRDVGVVMVPDAAVKPSQAGPAVFVVKPDQTVELRPVQTGRSREGKTVIQKGVEAGEVVVTDGQLRLGPGTKVQIKGGGEQAQKG